MERNPHPEIAEEEFRFADVPDSAPNNQMQEPSKETV